MVDEEQEKFLDDAMKNVKSEVYHIQSAIDKNQTRQCLIEAAAMLVELKSQLLNPKSYYNLYSVVFDEMQYVFNFFKEEARRGRRMKDLYDTVQQCHSIIPRLYLMITVGACYIDSDVTVAKEISYDLLNMVKGVQNPTRGLFTRYYLLKMFKERLPDKGNEFESEKATLEDSFAFIIQNLEEMNRLWIRLSSGSAGNEKLAKEKERNELRVLVGENIVRLASLTGLTMERYQEDILPKIINIIIECKDQLSQQYLIECIIHAFPDEFNIQCMSTLLDTTTKLNSNVDVITLLIALMDKIARYVNNSEKDQNFLISAAEKIFSLLKDSIDKHVQSGLNQPSIDTLKLTELQVAFMKFTIKCCSPKDKLVTVNYILNTANTILGRGPKKLPGEGVSLVRNMLTAPLESELSLFSMEQYAELMIYLDYSSRTTLALRIIESLSAKEKLDSTIKVNILLEFIRPLLEDTNDTIECDQLQFEYEQNIVSKLLYVVSTNDPIQYMEILCAIIPVFSKGGIRRIKYTLPTLANSFLLLGYQITASYEQKEGLVSDAEKNGIHTEFLNKFNMNSFNSSEHFERYIIKIHAQVGEIIKLMVQTYPEVAFKMYLDAAHQVDSIKACQEKFNEILVDYVKYALQLYQGNQFDGKNKPSLLTSLIGALIPMKHLSEDLRKSLTETIQQCASILVKRADQCQAMLACSHLFYSLLGQKDKTSQCLAKAKRFADFAMTNPENLILFVALLNKYLYYVEVDEELVKKEDVEDVIETLRNHIQTIKTENANQTFLPDIEMYFDATMLTLKKRIAKEGKNFYKDLKIDM